VIDIGLDDDALSGALRTKVFGQSVYAFESIDSTNAFAKSLAVKGQPEGALVYAEHQTAGRGRWGRTWESRGKKGLIFSLLLRPAVSLTGIGGLTLLAATSIAQVLERRLNLKPKLRWPNDVTVEGRKIAGILLEAQRSRGGVAFVVVGIGLNVNQVRSDFPMELQDKAGSLRMALGHPVNRLDLFAEAVLQLERDYRRFHSSGLDFVLNRWVRHNAILGKTITLKTRKGEETGTVKGFHTTGDLVLLDPSGKIKHFTDGEVIEVHHASGY
jgi:BirA family transcriptional regulator, biotin operon repressor / biotin---[acetyl-CoA-carboxylase] ligase